MIQYIVHKSESCVHSEHGICEGVTVESINGSTKTKLCECECHNSMYKLVRRMQISNNQY
jgi:hypothetical protein